MQNSLTPPFSSPLAVYSDDKPLQKRPIVWTIAGSDSGGGAGIQADMRAIESFDVHACSAIAAVTAQNSKAVACIEAVSASVLDAQLKALADDMPPAAIKTGMLATVENVRVVARWVDVLRKQAGEVPSLVVDPILRASTGQIFSDDALRQALISELLPRATVVKPNLKEAFWLVTGQEKTDSEIEASHIPALAQAIREMGAQSVVITGGDSFDGKLLNIAADWLDTPQISGWLSLPYEESATRHGTGCTYTASVAAALALNFCEADACILAKMATTYALRNGYSPGLGQGMVYAQKGFALQADLLPFLSSEPLSFPLCRPFPALEHEQMGLYAIVDSNDWVRRVIDAGVRTVQLRIKSDDTRIQGKQGRQFLSDEIQRSCAYAKAAGVQFFVNDHWELALEHGAYGVHIGQEDVLSADLEVLRQAGVRLGVSTYSLWDLCIAKVIAPSYYACGPIYETHSKEVSFLTQGIDNLAYVCHVAGLPVVAIGGINVTNIAGVVQAGAKGVAVISAIVGEPDTERAVAQLEEGIKQGQKRPLLLPPMLPHSVL